MARLIDADKLRERHCEGCNEDIREMCRVDPICASLLWVDEEPTVDAVPVVRCRECVLDNTTSCPLCWIENHTLQFVNHDPDFFCAYGERRTDD